MKKRTIAGLLSLVCLFSLSACIGQKSATTEWSNATYAILTKVNNGDTTLIGGQPPSQAAKEANIESLASWWDVTDRETLDERIAELRECKQNAKYLAGMKETGLTTTSKEELDLLLLRSTKDIYGKDLIRFMWEAYQKYGDNALVGWDLARANQLAGSGYLAGYYSKEECLENYLITGQQLQPLFSSWDEFIDSYMTGYMYWSNESTTDTSSDAAQRAFIATILKEEKDGPFSIPWDTELKKDWE